MTDHGSVIDENSKVPKYKQVADYIVSAIGIGGVNVGDRIPSINTNSEELCLSRDTVEKAYRNLRRRGIITAVKGKGFYVARSLRKEGYSILIVFNKLSDHKKVIFNSFMKRIGDAGEVDLQIHNSDAVMLEKIVMENLGKYDYYVIMPHLHEETPAVRAAINRIPKEKLMLINKDMEGIAGNYGCVYEDFVRDIRDALTTGLSRVKKYDKMFLVFPTVNYYCTGIRDGFTEFCREHRIACEIITSVADHEVRARELYVVIEEGDLVEIVKKAARKNLTLGRTVGVITYNDSPFKEILAGGIAVLSTDFERMGSAVADMIRTGKRMKIKNPFALTLRSSL